MNLWRKIESYIKPWIIVGVVLAFLSLGFCKEAEAGEVTAYVGAALLSGEFSQGYSGMFTEKFDNKYQVGMGVISRQEVTDRGGNFYKLRPQLFVFAERTVDLNSWTISVGPAYLNAKNRAIGSNFAATLSIQYHLSERLSIEVRHFSNAGSATPNMGQDLLYLGYTF